MSQAKPNPSMKTRWLIWRARSSLPGLLAHFDERKVVSLAAGFNGGMAILVIGLAAWLTDLPLVFPALGPSAFVLFSAPLTAAAAPRSVIIGHLTALASGACVWHLMSYLTGGPISMQTGGWSLFCGAALALALTCLLLVRFRCPHPPACATALVVALGAVTHWYDLLFMAVAVVCLTVQAVVMNRLSGLPVPTWSPRPQELA